MPSACDFTPQYEQLEELYRHYHNTLSVSACPYKDFGNQERASEDRTLTFCRTMSQVTFPLSNKINIGSAPVHPLYKWLTCKSLNEVSDNEVSWNFQLYAIDHAGQWQHMYTPEASPLDDRIINWIEAA